MAWRRTVFAVRLGFMYLLLLSGCYQRHLLSEEPGDAGVRDLPAPPADRAADLSPDAPPTCEPEGWRVETVSAGAAFGDLAVGIGDDGIVHVAFSRRDSGGSELHYGRRDLAGWETAALHDQVTAYPSGRSVALEVAGERPSLAYFGAAPESRAQAVWFRSEPFAEAELVTPHGRFLDVRAPHLSLSRGVVAYRGRVNGLVWAEPADGSWLLEPEDRFAPMGLATDVGPDGTRGFATRVEELVRGPGGAVAEVIERLQTHDRALELARRTGIATEHGCALEGITLAMHESGYDVVLPFAERTFTGHTCSVWHVAVADELRGGIVYYPFLPGESRALDMAREAGDRLHVAVVQDELHYAMGARDSWLVETVPVDARGIRSVRVAFGLEGAVAVALLRDVEGSREIVVAHRGPC